MNILLGFGCTDKVWEVFSPMDRKGICEAGRGEVSRICIPIVIWATGKNPCSSVKNGCSLLVCTTSLVRVAGLPCWAGLVVVIVKSTRSLSLCVHTCTIGCNSILCVLGL